MDYCTNTGGYQHLLAFGIVEVRPALYFVKEKHLTKIGVSNCEQRVRFLIEVQATNLLWLTPL